MTIQKGNITLQKISGLPISDGYAISGIYVIEEHATDIEVKRNCICDVEKKRFYDAKEKGLNQLDALYEKMFNEHGEDEAKIFEAHREILDDFEFSDQIETEIDSHNFNAEWAVQVVADRLVAMFEGMDNPYFQERAVDMKDICKRLQMNLSGKDETQKTLNQPAIIIAEDLTPSETSQLDKNLVLGIITAKGGKTSHSAIIARLLNIPYVVYPEIMRIQSIEDENSIIAMNGINGEIVINPEEEQIRQINRLKDTYEKEILKYNTVHGLEAVSIDGKKIELKANIGSVDDLDYVLSSDAQGIGLFRTEFIYMNRETLPTLEEQIDIYSTILNKMNGKPVTFRTLDIGGDKESPLFTIPKEMNPFLGLRGIRLCLDQQDIFRTQLKAILISSSKGKAKIMFPMISSIHELRTAKAILKDVEDELTSENIQYDQEISVGMMIETPSSVVMSDLLAKEVDFFSIGTNDLTQYTLAADRMNTGVSYLYSGYDPAVLRSIQKVALAARQEGIDVSICGELGADVSLLPMFLYFGITTLSMSSGSIGKTKWFLRQLNYDDLASRLGDYKSLGTEAEVRWFLEELS